MARISGHVVLFLVATTLVSYLQAFFHGTSPKMGYGSSSFGCPDLSHVTESNGRDVFLHVTSLGCGVRLDDVIVKQKCWFGKEKAIPTELVAPGLYKYRAPIQQVHSIIVNKKGFRRQTTFVHVFQERVHLTVKLACENAKKNQCYGDTVQLTTTYSCKATGLTTIPDISVSGPVTMATVSPGVVHLTKCPSCTGTVTMVVDGKVNEISVPAEDLVVDIHCSVDGGWSEYGLLSECSVTCGNGTMTRNRTCNNPAPEDGGAECVGENVETENCYTDPCPVDGGWSDYGLWSECSVTCGNGTMERNRTCNNPAPEDGGAECVGENVETENCYTDSCPVDGGWSDYGMWSECSVTCGNGTMERNRTCNNPAPEDGGAECVGENVETENCNTNPCHNIGQRCTDASDCNDDNAVCQYTGSNKPYSLCLCKQESRFNNLTQSCETDCKLSKIDVRVDGIVMRGYIVHYYYDYATTTIEECITTCENALEDEEFGSVRIYYGHCDCYTVTLQQLRDGDPESIAIWSEGDQSVVASKVCE